MSQQRYWRITFEQAYDLCRRGQDVYCTYSGRIPFKVYGLPDTTSKYTHAFFITEQLHKELNNMSTSKRTPVQAFRESRPAQDAWLEGKPIQFKFTYGDWTDYNGESPNFSNSSIEWRPKPEPVKVPFTMDTIPVDHWFRGKGLDCMSRVTTIERNCVIFGGTGGRVTYSYLASHCEHSPDRKTWYPCYTTEP